MASFVFFARNCLFAWIFLLLSPFYLQAIEIPKLEKRVTDLANLLSPETIQYLTKELETEELKTSNQIAVLILPSLDGESIESVAIQVFDEWKLGQKDKSNGILFLIAPNERKMRIEVGRGLEGFLPDVICNRIIKQVIRPEFKTGNYDKGVILGIQSILKNIDGSYAPSNTDTVTTKRKKKKLSFYDLFVGTILGFVLVFLSIRFDSLIRLILISISLFMFMGVFSAFFSFGISLAISLILQAITFVLASFWKSSSPSTSSYTDSGYMGGWGGGFGGGSWGGGSGDSWSGGDSSWGGGGGDSGGGGSSGDW